MGTFRAFTSEVLREPAAEMLGTMMLVLFGNGVQCQVVLGGNTNVSASEKGDYTSIAFGWACGTSLFFRLEEVAFPCHCCVVF